MRGATGVLLLITLLLSVGACSAAEAPAEPDPASTVVEVEGSDEPQVVLTGEAAEAAGVATARVAAGAAGAAGRPGQVVMPTSALMYYLDGSTWAYTVTGELTYLRVPVAVSRIAGDVVELSDGPAAGTEVVTTGATEILGAELEIDGEQ